MNIFSSTAWKIQQAVGKKACSIREFIQSKNNGWRTAKRPYKSKWVIKRVLYKQNLHTLGVAIPSLNVKWWLLSLQSLFMSKNSNVKADSSSSAFHGSQKRNQILETLLKEEKKKKNQPPNIQKTELCDIINFWFTYTLRTARISSPFISTG